MSELFGRGFEQWKADMVFGLAMLVPACIIAAAMIVAYVVWERRRRG